jgi:Secretion system C-terminal sorting domain
MKNKKLLFNHLFFQYHKSIGKLKRLSEKGLNIRKQSILVKRIEKIKIQILSIKYSLKKASAIAGLIGGIGAFQVNDTSAQSFSPAVVNPFTLSPNDSLFAITNPSFVDLDADGDNDLILVGYYRGVYLKKFKYYENIGNPNSPLFASPVEDPFSLSNPFDYFLALSFEDLDNDGDFDMMAGDGFGDFRYFENIGTNVLPEFDTAIINPFSLINIQSLYSGYSAYSSGNRPTLVDLDGDGDFDLFASAKEGYGAYYNSFYFFENVGNSSLPSFVNGVSYFGISPYGGIASFGDLDFDQDLDLLTANNGHWFTEIDSIDFYYSQNIGSNISPLFSSQLYNPFGLEMTEGYLQGFVTDKINYLMQSLCDLDGDGDLDIMAINRNNYDYPFNNNFYYFQNNMCDSVIATNIIIDDITLSSSQSDAIYQWVDCNNSNADIEGETNQSFTPIESGNYAVQINLNGCLATSECIDITVSGINDYSLGNKYLLVPNPTEGKLIVTANKPVQNVIVQIKSITGQIIFEQKNISGSNFSFDLSNHSNGLYFLEVTENRVTTRLKVVKEN